MIAEAIERFRQLCSTAEQPHVVRIAEDPERILIYHGEKESIVDVGRHRDHYVATLDDLLRAVTRWNQKGTIWHNDEDITFLLDDSTRLDCVTLRLTKTEQYETLGRLAKQAHGLDQRKMIRLLRHDLANTGADVERLLALIRIVEFKRRSDGAASLQHGKESLGRSVEAAVSAAEDIPELVRVSIAVYQEIGSFPVDVPCTVDVDSTSETFAITPQPGSLREVVDECQYFVHTYIKDHLDANSQEVDVFYGSYAVRS